MEYLNKVLGIKVTYGWQNKGEDSGRIESNL